MDKFVIRRPRTSLSTKSPRDRSPSDDRCTKRSKTGLINETREKESEVVPIDSLVDGEDENSGGDGDSMSSSENCDLVPFEDQLAAIEATDEALRTSFDGLEESQENTPLLYRNSIYVDAFNIALDTVLEQEGRLFSATEKAVFAAWRDLDYEAQYLYVRLFLRKEAAWHRTQRLGYQSDIGDMEKAIESLQQARELPLCDDDTKNDRFFIHIPQELILSSTLVFAQSFESVQTTVEDAVSLLSLDELKTLAKEMKATGKTKSELCRAIVHAGTKQHTLMSSGLRRKSSSVDSATGTTTGESTSEIRISAPLKQRSTSSRRGDKLVEKVMALTGPCIRICPSVFKLFERVHLVFYRTTEWTEKSLTTIVLAKMSKRNFPDYVVTRTNDIFENRQDLLHFESVLRLQFKVDQSMCFDTGFVKEDGFREVIRLFDSISYCWRELLKVEKHFSYELPEPGDRSYLRRFTSVHVLTRIAHYAAYCHGRLHQYAEEHALLEELLNQRMLHLARRGAWYQRKALLEERYMAVAKPNPEYPDESQQQKYWLHRALETCELALQDRDCHLIYHYDLQKRTLKLEKRLRIPRRLQHDFGHARLLAPEEHTVEGVQFKKDDGILTHLSKVDGTRHSDGVAGSGHSTKTVWLDERESCGGTTVECSVEKMCLDDYRKHGWNGYHSEGGIVRTLFGYLFFDILFMYLPNVFQTAYQACPLDLHTDTFYASRASEINRRLVEISNGDAPRIVRKVHDAHFARRTCIVGLKWDFPLEDVVELAECFHGDALALICRVLAEEYRQRGGGLPDLLLWRKTPKPEVLFSEVKSANDRLSDTQRMWIHILAGAGVRVAVCHAVAKQVRIR
ncbi:hypothetical protein SEPCBS57363_004387 [Sporothrix epigloea]|uniref:Fanconi-associated nuclease n=1 Tax=Sporothrix epigloea TaxID=1892477 RepID=A0ABP0DRR9_9PEZI